MGQSARAFLRRSALAIAVLVGLGLALILAAPALLRFGLAQAGYGPLTWGELSVGRERLLLTDLALGQAPVQRLGRLEARYDWQSLRQGRLLSLTLAGAELVGRLDQQGLALPGLSDADDATPSPFLALLPLPASLVVRQSVLDLATPAGQLRIPVDATLTLGDRSADLTLTSSDARLRPSAGGQLQAKLDATLHLPPGAPRQLASLTGQGHLSLSGADLAWPALGQGLTGTGQLDLTLGSGRLTLTSRDLAADLAAPAAALPGLPVPWRLQLGEVDRPLRLALPLSLGPGEVALSGPLALQAGSARLAAELALRLDGASPAARVTEGQLRLAASGVHADQFSLADGTLTLAATGDLTNLRAEGALDLRGEAEPIPGLRLAALRWQQPLTLAVDRSIASLGSAAPGQLTLGGASWNERWRTGPASLELRPQATPNLSLERVTGRWQAELTGSLAPLQVDGPGARLWARVEQLTGQLAGGRDGMSIGGVELAGGRLDWPGRQLSAAGISLRWPIEPAGTIPIAIERLSQTADAAWTAPLALQAELTPSTDSLAFAGSLRSRAAPVRLSFTGRHRWADGQGEAALDLPLVTFVPGQLQPGQLMPALAGTMSEAVGQLALQGGLRWRGSALTSDLDLLVKELGFTAGPARVERINGVVRFDRPLPPRTPPGQELAIALLDLGLPLTDGVAALSLPASGGLSVERLDWRVAGGQLRAAPFTVGSATTGIKMQLTAERLDLGQLLDLARLEGLAGEGQLSGELPLEITGGAAAIRQGQLTADGPGTLRYRPAAKPGALQAGGASVDLLLRAIENFHYDTLGIKLDGRTDAAMAIGLDLKGANPDLYDGHPIDFHLNLEGALGQILQSSLVGYQLPQRIEERVRGFGR